MGVIKINIGVTATPEFNDSAYVGEDIRREFQFSSETDGVTTPVDYTGWTAISEIRNSPGTPVIATWTVIFEITPPSLVPNTISLFLPNATSGGMDARDYCYDVKGTDPGGEDDYLFGGVFRLSDPCTA